MQQKIQVSRGTHCLGLWMKEALSEESLRNRSFMVNSFPGIWNKLSRVLLSGTLGVTTQHFEPIRGEKPRVIRLLTSTIRGEKGAERVPPHQITPLTARVTTTAGSLSAATRGAAGTSHPAAPISFLRPAPWTLSMIQALFSWSGGWFNRAYWLPQCAGMSLYWGLG